MDTCIKIRFARSTSLKIIDVEANNLFNIWRQAGNAKLKTLVSRAPGYLRYLGLDREEIFMCVRARNTFIKKKKKSESCT